MEINQKALIVTAACDENVYKSARNIKGVTPTYVDVLNAYEVLKHDKFIIAKDAVLLACPPRHAPGVGA